MDPLQIDVLYQSNNAQVSPTDLKKQFPKAAVIDTFMELLTQANLSGTVVIGITQPWKEFSALRHSTVMLYGRRDVVIKIRVNERPVLCDVRMKGLLAPNLFDKLRAASDALNYEQRKKTLSEAPAVEIEGCRRKIMSLERRRSIHTERLSQEQYSISLLDAQIESVKQRIKSLQTAT